MIGILKTRDVFIRLQINEKKSVTISVESNCVLKMSKHFEKTKRCISQHYVDQDDHNV